MRPPLIPALAVLLLLGATACSSSSGSAAGSASGSAAGSDSGAAKALPPSPGSTGSGAGDSTAGGNGGSDQPRGTASSSPATLFGADQLPTPAADHCRTEHLTAQARTTGEGRAAVVITNKGDSDCTVRGFPSLLLISGGNRLELPVDWAGSAAEAEEHTLAPGASASAALTFISFAECDTVTGLDVVPPGESRPLTPGFTTSAGTKRAVHICDTGVRVQAFRPSG